MRIGTRAIAAAFDAIVMIAAAYTITGGSFADPHADIVVWGSAAAAVVAALVVLGSGPAAVGWVAVGYVLFAAFLAVVRPVPLLVLLAVAYMPILPRPRGSLVQGLLIAAATAVVVAIAVRAL
ncbi:MAG: hypothetical protein KGN00_10920 [Chloroflexota bacterium]|nr:hypothetical protein [Chloroflexota bacterium]MDE3194190.1 hypothetical protein [Chloroflexota bacterium]